MEAIRLQAVVLGTGMIGTAIAIELADSGLFDKVTAVDASAEALQRCQEKAAGRVAIRRVNLGEPGALEAVMEGAGVAVAALPHSLSLGATEAAIAARCHLVDLVGSRYPDKAALSGAAQDAGVLIVPGCGVAPGITNVLAGRGVELLDETDDVTMLCGGIPEHPLPPLGYQVVFRLESVMGLYTRPATAIVDGVTVELPPLSGLEKCVFPAPIGECEAAISDAHSTAYTLKGKVKNLVEKTVRYPGHFGKMAVLAELGFLSDKPVTTPSGTVTPKEVAMAVLEPLMRGGSHRDATVLRVTVTGRRNGVRTTLAWEMVDLYDEAKQMTSMAKTTAFPAAIVAEWIATGRLREAGVVPPESLLIGERFEPFMAELKKKGIEIKSL